MFVQSERPYFAEVGRRQFAWRHLARTAAYCGVALLGLVTFFLLLQGWVLESTRNHRIMNQVSVAAQTGVLSPASFPISAYGHAGLNYDMFTECLTISINLGNENEPLLYRLAAAPYAQFARENEQSPCRFLIADSAARKIELVQPYFRYWHGAQVYLRPLLANTSLANVHIITALLLIGALAWFAVVLARTFGVGAVPLLIVPMAACTNILTVPASTVHALTWIWAFVSLAVITPAMVREEINAPRMLILAFALGAVAAFLDGLFSPPFAPTLMAFIAIALGIRRTSVLNALYAAALVGLFWFLGFSLTWIAKWVFSTAVLGWDVVKPNLFDAITERSLDSRQIAPELNKLFTASKLALGAQKPGFHHGGRRRRGRDAGLRLPARAQQTRHDPAHPRPARAARRAVPVD